MTLLGEEMQSVVPCYHSDVKLKIPLGKEEEEKNTARVEIKPSIIKSEDDCCAAGPRSLSIKCWPKFQFLKTNFFIKLSQNIKTHYPPLLSDVY